MTDIRIFWTSTLGTLMTRDEAVSLLVNHELPQRVLLAGTNKEMRAAYKASTPDKQEWWRRSYEVYFTVTAGDSRGGEWYPQPQTAVEVHMRKSGELRFSVGGHVITSDTAVGLQDALTLANQIVADAIGRSERAS